MNKNQKTMLIKNNTVVLKIDITKKIKELKNKIDKLELEIKKLKEFVEKLEGKDD